jgi:glycosyltransferase involved in cell wall biosynthesis
MEIGLITEGTYPFHLGGVAVWCDQLMRGLTKHRFHVIAIGGDGHEKPIWATPPNCAQLEPIWLYEPNPSSPASSKRSPDADETFIQAHARFVDALLRPAGGLTDFIEALKTMRAFALHADLEAALTSNAALERLVDGWTQWQHERRKERNKPRDLDVTISLAEALAVSRLMARQLKPLYAPTARVEVMHAVSNGLAALPAMAAKWAHGTPFVLTEHGVYLRERYLSYTAAEYPHAMRALILNFYRLLTGAAYQMAELIVPGSHYNQRWELRGGADPKKIHTVYNGIDPTEFSIAAEDPAEPTITWLGRVDPLKDLHTLIRAFALVRAEQPEAKLRLLGPTPAGNEAYLKSCQALVRELWLESSVHFEGRVASALEAYHGGHVFAMTSISEGFPYTLIEAMACGCAVVATDVGGVGEAVSEAGVIVPPRDHAAVAHACLELLSNPGLRRKLGGAARARVLTQFTLEKCLNAYSDIYDQAMHGKTPTAELSLGRHPLMQTLRPV